MATQQSPFVRAHVTTLSGLGGMVRIARVPGTVSPPAASTEYRVPRYGRLVSIVDVDVV